jgi:hypothetical protein
MSPFQDSHQPTHAGQPAGAFSFAPDEEPIASSFDGEGPPFDSTFSDAWMDPPGFWDPEFALQSAFDLTLNDQAMLPPFYAEVDRFDYSLDNWTAEFGTGAASQSALGPAFNGMMPPFDAEWSPFGSNPWTDQPLGLLAKHQSRPTAPNLTRRTHHSTASTQLTGPITECLMPWVALLTLSGEF